jgi:hypothetical protein
VARLLAGRSLLVSSSDASEDDDEPRLSLARLLDPRGSSPTAKAMARWCPSLKGVSGRHAAYKVAAAAGPRSLLTEKDCLAFVEGHWARIKVLKFHVAGTEARLDAPTTWDLVAALLGLQ